MLIDYVMVPLLVSSLLPLGRLGVLSPHHVHVRVLGPHGALRVLVVNNGGLVA